MKARPILMHARSIQNLLSGRKTQTRRIMKRKWGAPHAQAWSHNGGRFEYADNDGWHDCRAPECPYGAPGDLLWVRETFAYDVAEMPSGDREAWVYRATSDVTLPWTPSIHMPRRASRLTLRLTDVRVQLVQQIDNEDARAEGCRGDDQESAATYFERLWDDTNGRGAWDRNDWVWVLAFEVLRENVDAVLAKHSAPERRIAKSPLEVA